MRVSPTQLGLRAKQQNEFRGYPLIEEEELQRYLEICDDSERPDTRHWKNLGFALAKMCNHVSSLDTCPMGQVTTDASCSAT